jgi:hypothetical protein
MINVHDHIDVLIKNNQKKEFLKVNTKKKADKHRKVSVVIKEESHDNDTIAS